MHCMQTNLAQRLAKRLRELRDKNSLSQEALAEKSGIDYKHIQLLESKNPPFARLDTLEKIAKAFKLSLAKFLDF